MYEQRAAKSGLGRVAFHVGRFEDATRLHMWLPQGDGLSYKRP